MSAHRYGHSRRPPSMLAMGITAAMLVWAPVSLSCAPGATTAAAPPEAAYAFDGNANDGSGNGHDGRALDTGAAADRLGDPGRAMSFNGASSHVVVNDSSGLNFGPAQDFSIALWLQCSGQSAPRSWFVPVLHKRFDHPTPKGWGIGLIHGTFAAEITVAGRNLTADSVGLAGTTEICDGRWHAVAMVVRRAETTAELFVDGRSEKAVRDPGMGLALENTADLVIGATSAAQGSDRFFRGALDDLRIYRRALSSAEVARVSQAGGGNDATPSVSRVSLYRGAGPGSFYVELSRRVGTAGGAGSPAQVGETGPPSSRRATFAVSCRSIEGGTRCDLVEIARVPSGSTTLGEFLATNDASEHPPSSLSGPLLPPASSGSYSFCNAFTTSAGGFSSGDADALSPVFVACLGELSGRVLAQVVSRLAGEGRLFASPERPKRVCLYARK